MGDTSLCIKDLIPSGPAGCQYVQDNCVGMTDTIPFIELYYCQLHQSVPAVVAMSIFFVVFVFNFLGTTAENYLGPSLQLISNKLKLSQAIAGITLLALANGASDVAAGLTAGGKGSAGLSIAVGGLFGASLFTTTMALSRCIAGAGTIRVDPTMLKTNITFLLLAVLYFVFLTIIGTITWYTAIGFFVIYGVFFGYVLYTENSKGKRIAGYKTKLAKVKALALKKGLAATPKERNQPTQSPTQSEDVELAASPKETNESPLIEKVETDEETKKVKKAMRFWSMKTRNFDDEEEEEEEENDGSCIGKVLEIVNLPIDFIRNITIIPFQRSRWNVWYAAATPIFGILFLMYSAGLVFFDKDHLYVWVVYGVVAVSLSIFLLIVGRKTNLAANHSGKLALFAFICSALWLNLVAGCFMDFLALITLISGLPLNYLSLTLLAWGNSLDDYFNDYAISKAGKGNMAVAGVYGGQLFNLLIGFGGSMMLQGLLSPVKLDIYDFTGAAARGNILTCVLLACTIFGLVSTLTVAKFNKYVLGQKMKYFLMAFYGTFVVAATLVVFA